MSVCPADLPDLPPRPTGPKPGARCEACDKKLKKGEVNIVHSYDWRRVWHTVCFHAPQPKKRTKAGVADAQ